MIGAPEEGNTRLLLTVGSKIVVVDSVGVVVVVVVTVDPVDVIDVVELVAEPIVE
jgi:hypothetical protein